MGSGLIQAYVATWGALVGETTLSGNSASITVSNIPTGFNYLHIFINARSTDPAGPIDWEMVVNGGGTYNGTYSLQSPPAALAVTNYFGAAAWPAPQLGDSFTNCFSAWLVVQDPTITIKTCFVNSMGFGSEIYTQACQVILPPGDTQITEIKLQTTVGGTEFKSGSKISVYGLN